MNINRILIMIMILIVAVLGVFSLELFSGSQRSIVVLATTTSTYDSGLLDYLIPRFEARYGLEVRIISVGTGQAIEIAKRGDADLILVHSRRLELELINSTYGIHRIGVMYNDFVIIGPRSDPAGIKGLENATEAFRRIAEMGARGNSIFISRADRSGTHTLELEIWEGLGLTPSKESQTWYLESGSGMGAVLRMANEKGAYTLTDRATWLSLKDQLKGMDLLVQGDLALLNPYAVVLVNPEKYPQRNHRGALTLARWMISGEGQSLLEEFFKGGETLFKPIARDIQLARRLGFQDQEKELEWYDSQNP